MLDKTEEKKLEEGDSTGATVLEYALLACLIALVCVVAMTLLGQEASESFSKLGSGFAAASS